MSKQEIEVLTAHFEDLPAVRAWASLGHPAPRRVEILRRKKKSVIYRLVAVGRGGTDVIVKSCYQNIAAVEHRIYAEVLPQLGMEFLGYYGLVDSGNGTEPAAAPGEGSAAFPGASPPASPGAGSATAPRFCWLFLEDAAGEELDPANSDHREAATRWLARLHTASTGLTAAAELPHRGPSLYLEHLHQARRTIRQNYGNPVLSPADREVLDQVLDRFDDVEGRWEEIEAAGREMPWALVHGDFAERNVQLRRDGTALAVFVFDWEVAGWGPAPVDLAHADVALYWSLVRSTWPGLDLESLQRQAALCRLLRGGIAATSWCADSLATPWVEKPIRDLVVYCARMTECMRVLGWAH